jgi:DNA-binding transcriptional regulator YdaS (Cro superfamily)
MTLRDYLHALTPDQRTGFAMLCGTSAGHLRNVAHRYKLASPELALAIERETRHEVTVEEVRPDLDWSIVRR